MPFIELNIDIIAMEINKYLKNHLETTTKKLKRTSKSKPISVQKLVEIRLPKIKSADVDLSLLKHLKTFSGKDITTKDIDANFCHSFVQYLVNDVNIKPGSVKTYLQKLHAILQEAVEMGYTAHNPMPPISKLIHKTLSREKDHLNTEEVKQLQKTDCLHLTTKLAFLFSCFTGLRLSDIETLKWTDIQKCNNMYMLVKIQVKTGTEVRIPLNKQALRILTIVQNKKLSKGEKVFTLHSRTTIAADLKAWAKHAGINKHITFHVSRISFVTLSIAAGINIYVVSKLCGHSNVKTTQIYARMIERTYIDAIALFENIFEQKRKNIQKTQKFNLIL